MDEDSILLEECKDNNSASFEKLYAKYASEMKGVAFRYVNDSSLAEDIIQEAFIKVFVNIKKFDPSLSFVGWLNRVVVNAAISHCRKFNYKEESNLEINDSHNEIEDSEIGEANEYTMEELIESINSLPEGYKLVFNMYVIDNFSHKEIAAALNITEGTSKSQLSKSREFLKKILEKQKTVTNAR